MVRKKQCTALIKLYEREIIRCLESIYREPEKGQEFTELLTLGRIDEIKEESDGNIQEFAKKLFQESKESPLSKADDERLYRIIMSFLQKYLPNSNLHQLLKCTDSNVKRSEFRYILDNVDEFLEYTDPTAVLRYLDSYPQYHPIIEAIRGEISMHETEDLDLFKKLVLRTVPLLGDYAVFDIMFTISEDISNNHNSEARAFIERILKLPADGFRRYYDCISSDRSLRRGQIYICPINESATEMMVYLRSESIEVLANNPRYRMINIRFDNIQEDFSSPRLIIDSVRQRIHLQRPLTLRNYQEELCHVALRGENTIVTAPTGSGKTVIAANIIKNHFETRQSIGKRYKALFMTPNSMILKQQSDSITSYLDHAYHTQIIQGADNVPPRGAIQSKDLIVATPQMIVNLCNEHLDEIKSSNEFGVDKFYLSTFTLIIFDECHNTLKNSPYSNIMREYHTLKNMGNMPDGHELPQIIGLTASLGAGDAKNDNGVREHIANLCANMDVRELSTVKDNILELRRYSPIIPDTVRLCPRSTDGAIGEFTTWISDMMRNVELLLRSALAQEHVPVREQVYVERNSTDREYQPDVGFMQPPDDKEKQAYLNWVCNQKNVVSTASFANNFTKIAMNESLRVLEDCHWTLSYNANFNPTVALNYLKKEMDSRSGDFTEPMARIWQRYHQHLANNGTAVNPMIIEVERYIVDQNQQRNDSRTIIFVRTRYEAMILSEILNQNETLRNLGIRSEWMSGLNRTVTNSEISASKQKQMEKLKQFASGEIRVLVSTSVAEEGLDVAECNLVIKYNYATNEIAHVQRRGRGRALNSTCILITNNVSLSNQESVNKDKETMMMRAIADIQRCPEAFRLMVSAEIDKIWERIKKEDTERAQTIDEQIKKNITYKIVCKKCDVFLCTNSDIRSKGSQYLVCRPEFWSLVRKVAGVQDRFNITGKIFCRGQNCGALLGRLLDISSTDLPCIGADAIVLINQETEDRFSVKKWKQILSNHFTPVQLRQLDVQNMRNATQENQTITFEHFMENGMVENLVRGL